MYDSVAFKLPSYSHNETPTKTIQKHTKHRSLYDKDGHFSLFYYHVKVAITSVLKLSLKNRIINFLDLEFKTVEQNSF